MVWPTCENLAADSSASEVVGTWKITPKASAPPGSGPTLKFKSDGAKLTGTCTMIKNSQPVKRPREGINLRGNEIAFTTRMAAAFYQNGVLQPDQTNMVSVARYQGLVQGDSIKGKVEKEYLGQKNTSEWEAKRVRE